MIPSDPFKFAKQLGSPPRLVNKLHQKDYNQYKAADALRRVVIHLQDRKYVAVFFNMITDSALELLLAEGKGIELLPFLYTNNLLPTTAILDYVDTCGGEKKAVSCLEEELNRMKSGGFDKNRALHREIAYSSLVLLQHPDKWWKGNQEEYVRFELLPLFDPETVRLSSYENEKIHTSALQCQKVFERILSYKKQNIPLIVVGNRRYGANFVVKPLERFLIQEGIQVVYECVHSTEADRRPDTPFFMGLSWKKLLAETRPDVVIVDGTVEPEKDKLTRFPSAFNGYLATFKNFLEVGNISGYAFCFWAPDMTESFYVGQRKFTSFECDGDRKIILLSSTTDALSSAYFDDCEDRFREKDLVFSSAGLILASKAKSADLYVSYVKQALTRTVASILTNV